MRTLVSFGAGEVGALFSRNRIPTVDQGAQMLTYQTSSQADQGTDADKKRNPPENNRLIKRENSAPTSPAPKEKPVSERTPRGETIVNELSVWKRNDNSQTGWNDSSRKMSYYVYPRGYDRQYVFW